MRKIMTIIIFLSFALIAYAQDFSDYLITSDIASYKKITKGGPSGNILAGTDHFGLDHNDSSYGISYVNDESKMWIDVQVTQHAGADSDKWLLHEVESSFRGREKEGWLGQGLHGSASIREINGNKIFDYGNIDYRWISNNVVVYIHYTDLEGTKPEPLEIVQAYLQKFPSTITMTDAEAKSHAHNEKWIKDEMERRLWLGDKWFMALQLKKAEEKTVYKNTVDSMQVFLDYREKYYGIGAKDEKKLLFEYRQTNNGTGIKNKLAEYKKWWDTNKGKPISL